MKKRVLGRTGFQVTEIGFGAWPIGGGALDYGHVAEKEAQATIENYIELGGNFIDTAETYGKSERILGDFFQENGGREDVFIASKTAKLDPVAIQEAVDQSLCSLQTDTIDVYYMHSPPDDPQQMNRVLDVYESLKEEGKIRAIGASIKGPNVAEETVDLCRQYIRSGRVDVLLVIYSIFRQKNKEMFQEAVDNGVGIVARTVLESGFLTGEYAPGHEFTGKDHRARWEKERLTTILEEVQDLEEWCVVSPYKKLNEVAIRFVLDHEAVSSAVLGVQSPQEIEENVAVSSLPPLGQELVERLYGTYNNRTKEFNT